MMKKFVLLSSMLFESIALQAMYESRAHQEPDQETIEAAQMLLLLGQGGDAAMVDVADDLEQEEQTGMGGGAAGGGAPAEVIGQAYTFNFCTLCPGKPQMGREQLVHHCVEKHSPACPFPGCTPSKKFLGNSYSNYSKHFKTHEQYFFCESCNKDCKTQGSLEAHNRQLHNGKKNYFPCPIKECPAKIKRANGIFDHLQSVHSLDNQGWNCALCPTRLGTSISLKNHMIGMHADKKGHDELLERGSLIRKVAQKLNLYAASKVGPRVSMADFKRVANQLTRPAAQESDSDDDSSSQESDDSGYISSSSASSSSSDGSIEVIINKKRKSVEPRVLTAMPHYISYDNQPRKSRTLIMSMNDEDQESSDQMQAQ